MIYPDIRTAAFIDRPNRFVAHVELDGAVQTVHVKNTGRCKVSVQILEPIDAGEIEKRQGDNDPRKELMPLVRSRMEAAL